MSKHQVVSHQVRPSNRKTAKRVTDLPTIARRYGRGNVRIQLGRVMSSAEYKANKERVLRYAF